MGSRERLEDRFGESGHGHGGVPGERLLRSVAHVSVIQTQSAGLMILRIKSF